jgi:hypothetical protein
MDKEREIIREFYLDRLHNDICTVIFTKVDGTERTMVCTLHPSRLPPVPETKEDEGEKKTRTPRPLNVISVYELGDKPGWRSFKIENVISFASVAVDLWDDIENVSNS